MSIWSKFKRWWGFPKEGKIKLHHGKHAIIIDLIRTPSKIWLSFGNEIFIPICWGNVDYAGADIIQDGFILYADIYSSCRCIYWRIEF